MEAFWDRSRYSMSMFTDRSTRKSGSYGLDTFFPELNLKLKEPLAHCISVFFSNISGSADIVDFKGCNGKHIVFYSSSNAAVDL